MSEPSLILLIDDEESFREIFQAKFSRVGFRLETAQSGEEGLKKVKELKPDLVLMDVKMPGMDGVETAMKLKEDPETKDIKVVFLTSLGNIEEEAQRINVLYSQEIGASGYIKKTDDLDKIVSKVQSFISTPEKKS